MAPRWERRKIGTFCVSVFRSACPTVVCTVGRFPPHGGVVTVGWMDVFLQPDAPWNIARLAPLTARADLAVTRQPPRFNQLPKYAFGRLLSEAHCLGNSRLPEYPGRAVRL